MNWFFKFLTSSIGKKLIMSLTGVFLIVFLKVHLLGNLQLLYNDGGEAFNVYGHFMTTNPLIKFTSYGLYFFILLHAIQGILIARKNKMSRGSNYAVKKPSGTSFASRNMALLGSLVFVFLVIHMGDFWYAMKFTDSLEMVNYSGVEEPVKNLYKKVALTFEQPWFVVLYVVSMIVLALHLIHGFQSAFQTLGLNHKKYTPFIKIVGILYSILIPLGFAIIPLCFFFCK